MKTYLNFRDQTWNFYPISIKAQVFIEDCGKLKHPKKVKSINNTTASHLVSCRVITRLATMIW